LHIDIGNYISHDIPQFVFVCEIVSREFWWEQESYWANGF